MNLNPSELQIETENGRSFIKLPNGDVVTIEVTGDTLFFSHRESIESDCLDALPVYQKK